MKKFIQKLVSISLASFMVVALVACGGQSNSGQQSGTETATTESSETTETSAPAKQMVIGGLGSSLVSSFQAALLNSDEIAKTYGLEYVTSDLPGYDDEAFLTMYENIIDQGANCLIVYTFSESAIKLVADLCAERDVDFFVANRQITDPQLKDYVYSLPNFVGTCYCNETQIAYDLVKEMSEEQGVKNLAVIGLQQGDINGDYRDTGIVKACEDYGVNLLTETRGITTVEDVTNAVEGMIASYPEMDGIFIVGGAVTPGGLAGAAQALANQPSTHCLPTGQDPRTTLPRPSPLPREHHTPPSAHTTSRPRHWGRLVVGRRMPKSITRRRGRFRQSLRSRCSRPNRRNRPRPRRWPEQPRQRPGCPRPRRAPPPQAREPRS